MSNKITKFTGSTPILEKCATIFEIYIEERGISIDSAIVFAGIYKFCFHKRTAISYTPQDVPISDHRTGVVMHGDRFSGTPVPESKPFLLNLGLFCLRSLIGEIRPQFTQSYGTIPTDMENCDTNLTKKRLENLFRVTNRCIIKKVIPHRSEPDIYIKMLLDFYEELSLAEMPLWQNKNTHSHFVSFFYNHSAPPLDVRDSIIHDIQNYEYYANNVVPFYLDPEKDPFLSPYNYDANIMEMSPLVPPKTLFYVERKDPVLNIHNRILFNFCLLKKKKLITTYICTAEKGAKHEVLYDDTSVPGMTILDNYVGFGTDPKRDSIYDRKICKYCFEFAKKSANRLVNINLFILPNNYLNFFWGDDYYQSVAKDNGWGTTMSRDQIIAAGKYKIAPSKDVENIAFGLWQAGLYNILNKIIGGVPNTMSQYKTVVISPGVTLADIIIGNAKPA